MPNEPCVIILNYRGGWQTVDCIHSVREALGVKVYLVDNSEDTNEIAFIKGQFLNEPDLILICNERNVGFAGGVNAGLRSAIKDGYDRFLILNNDVKFNKKAGDAIIRAFGEKPGSLISPVIQWDGNECRGRSYHKYLGLIADGDGTAKSGWLFYFTGCALAFDKKVIDQIGLFNEQFFMYGEDVEFCHRARSKQIPLVLLDNVTISHKGSHSAKMASYFYEYHINRAHLYLSGFLFHNAASKVFSLIGKSLFLFGRAIVRSFRYKSFSPIMGYLSAPLPLKIRPKW